MPNVELLFLLKHLRLSRIVNIVVEHPIGLGFFSEQELESFYQSSKNLYGRYVGVKDKLKTFEIINFMTKNKLTN